jgi:putative addiction module component (TIGR02574 family)
MTQAAEKLKEVLVTLPVDDRAELAHFLLRSLDEEADPDVEAAWDAELTRRDAEIRSGQAELRPADEVFARLREKHS